MDVELKIWEQNNKHQLNPPKVAYPTIGLFFLALLLFISTTYFTITGLYPMILGIVINGLSAFMFFTVAHDASHRSLSQNNKINETLGAISLFFLSPLAGIRVFRFIHMQHHRFTNHGSDKDPDAWCGRGNKWTLPLRWMTLDFQYVVWYLNKWQERPAKERKELVLTLSTMLFVVISLTSLGFGKWLILLWFLPSRIAVTWLALCFDYLPHYPHDTTNTENPYLATNIRPTLSALMTPFLLEQNYHLIHHLYPRVPFYRYHKLWREIKPQLRQAGARVYTWRSKKAHR